MRFHRLEIENLNSLYGSQVIDFDGHYASAPLLLIHGVTGSGKSTILDAVCLALFGTTPRLGAHRNDEASSPTHIMSRLTGRASALLEFSLVEDGVRSRWRAGWSLHRARQAIDGAFQRPTRELARLNPSTGEWENIVTSTQNKDFDPAFKSALQGLSANDFQRCVLLAQGNFDALLSASREDRKRILQNVVDVSRFKEIGVAVAEGHRKAKTRLDELNKRFDMGAQELLDEPAREELRGQEAELQRTIEHRRQRIDATARRVEWTKQKDALRITLASAQKSLAEIEETRAARADDFAKLQRHDALEAPAHKDLQLQAVERSLAEQARDVDAQRVRTDEAIAAEELAKSAFQAQEVVHVAAAAALDDAGPRLVAAQRAWSDLELAKQQRNSAEEAQKKTAATLHSQRETVARLQEDLADLNQRLQAANQEREALGVREELLQYDTEISSHLVSLREGFKAYKSCENAHKEAHEALQRATQTRELAHAEKTKEAAKLAELQASLQRLRQGLPLESPSAAERALQEDVDAARNLAQRLDNLSLARREEATASAALETNQRAADAVEQELAIAQERHATLQETATAVEEHVRNIRETLVSAREFLELAESLRDDEPCPLCGSQEHVGSDDRRDKMEARCQDLEQTLQKVDERRRDAAEQFKAAEQSLTVARERRATVAERLKASTDAMREVNRRLAEQLAEPALQPYAAFDIRALDDAREQQADLAAQREVALERAREIADLMRSAGQQQSAAQAKLESADAAIQDAGVRVERTRIGLQKEDELLTAEREKAQLLLEKFSLRVLLPDQANLEETSTLVGLALGALAKKIAPLRSKIEAVRAIHTEIQKREELLRTRQEDLLVTEAADNDAATVLAERSTACDVALLAVQGFFEGRAPEKVRQELESALRGAQELANAARARCDAAAEQRALNASQLAQLHAQQQLRQEEARRLSDELVKLLDIQGLSSRERLREERLEPALGQALRAELEALNSAKEQARMRALLEAERLNELLAAPPEGGRVDEEERLAMDALVAENNQAQETLGGLRERLSEDARRRAALEEASAAIDAAKADLVRWQSVNSIAGLKDGERFVEYALALCMGELIQYANMNLRMLSARYQLRQLVEDDGAPVLDFEVVDLDQGGEVRPTSTLSGGERFILSLSLALGLGNTVRSKLRFETLMIDEGFGTLDADTLRKVIATLGDLQLETGAQVMLISHVEMLAERIPAQIRVVKQGGGRSLIELRGGA